jgi:hypothetical protein
MDAPILCRRCRASPWSTTCYRRKSHSRMLITAKAVRTSVQDVSTCAGVMALLLP